VIGDHGVKALSRKGDLARVDDGKAKALDERAEGRLCVAQHSRREIRKRAN
jgi:hypothetical protein